MALLGLTLLFLWGCGSGGSGSKTPLTSAANISRGTGRVQVAISWPARTPATSAGGRYIPPYAASLHFEMFQPATPNTRFTLDVNRPNDRPSTQVALFDQFIPEGTYTLAGVARVGTDGQGETVASAVTTVTVVANQLFTANLTLNSTIKSIAILSQPITVPVGSTQLLIGQAVDPDGKIILLPGDALSWSVVTGGQFGTVTSGGLFTPIAPGTVHIRLSEPGAGLSSEADVTVTAAGTGGNGSGGLANSSWPKYQGNAQNTGRASGMGAKGTIAWTFKSTQLAGVALGPDNTVYVSTDDSPDFSNFTDKVVALDPKTGLAKWTTILNTGQSAASGSPTLGANGLLYLVEITPANQNDAATVVALDSKTGAIQWKFDTGNQYLGNSVTIGPDGTVYFSAGLNVFALDGQSGVKKWEAPGGGSISAAPALGTDGTLYVAGNPSLTALNSSTGALKWTSSQTAGRYSTPSVGQDGNIYTVVTGQGNNTSLLAIALDSRTGLQKWTFTLGSFFLNDTAPALGADGTVYITSPTAVYALDNLSGAQKWVVNSTGAANVTAPVIDGSGTVYYYDLRQEKLVGVDGKTGTQKFVVAIPSLGNIVAVIAIGSDGTLYVTNTETVTAVH